MTKARLFKEGFKLIQSVDLTDKDAVIKALNDFVYKFGLVPAPVRSNEIKVPNKSEPTFDTLDFDDISSHFDD